MAFFKYFPVELFKPDFDSRLTSLIIELDYLRKKRLIGTTPPFVFMELKSLYHSLESIYSARIEGNHTTIVNYLEQKSTVKKPTSQEFLEIQNIQNCLNWIEKRKKIIINHDFIKTIHKKIVEKLDPVFDGDMTPGEYRNVDIMIGKSEHLPPDPSMIDELMDELIEFSNKEDHEKYDLIKIATIHHRLTWIHPFANGNGRTVRALTYALLIKYKILTSRITNPTAIFCKNRDEYYKHLGYADSGKLEGVNKWLEYVLEGLKIEIDKVDKLTDKEFIKNNLILPVIKYNYEKGFFGSLENEILVSTVNTEDFIISKSDIKTNAKPYMITRVINQMIDKKLIKKYSERKYILNLQHPKLLVSIAYQLERIGFLPEKVDKLI